MTFSAVVISIKKLLLNYISNCKTLEIYCKYLTIILYLIISNFFYVKIAFFVKSTQASLEKFDYRDV